MRRVLRVVYPKTWEEYFQDFLMEKQLAGCRERTIRDYCYHVSRFFQGYEGDLQDFEALRRRCLEYLGGEIAPATFNLRRAYLNNFFCYLIAQGVLSENPLKGIRARKDEGKARALPREVVEKLLDLPDKRTFTGLRNYTLLLLSLDTGIRPREAIQLLPEDFNLEAREVVIRKEVAKTKTSRTLPLSPLTCLWVRKLLQVRPKCWGNDVPVFCSQDGKPLCEYTWSHILREYSKKIGYRVTPYDLRHTFALYSLREGINPFALQRILGHTDLTMTKRYLALTNDDLKSEHNKSSPLKIFEARRLKRVLSGGY
jgi:integrase